MRDATTSATEEATTTADVHRFFRGLIVSGGLGNGEKLPTVRQAAADFGVAPGTVQKAYRVLEQDGLIVSRVGSGTRVAPGASVLSADLTRLLRAAIDTAAAEGIGVDALIDVLPVLWSDAHSA